MTQPGVFTPYSTVAPLLGTLPGWVDPFEQERIAAYAKYEEIYWSSEEGFVEVMRGDNEQPLFVPTARTLVNTVDRYTAPGFDFQVTGPTDNDVAVTRLAFEALFKREKFKSRFQGNKIVGIRKGDWFWHLVADPTKPAGQRLRLLPQDPGSYFPVYDADEPDRLVKIHLAAQVRVGGKDLINRMTYEKILNADGTSTIVRSHGLFKPEKWWESTKPEQVILNEEALPPEITAFPVYHIKNLETDGPFGSSELRGLETTLAGINQAVSDEDLTLALEGLGVWATDGAPPVDANGDQADLIMGPGRVISRANGLRKLTGTTSVTPYQDHIKMLERLAKESLGISDVTLGQVSATDAESGVALLLRMGPMLAHTAKKDQEILDVHTQMFYDLQKWLAVYEDLPLLDGSGALAVPRCTVLPTIGPKVPTNLAQVIKEVVDLRSTVPPVLSLRTSHQLLRDAGMAVPDDELAQLAAEAAQQLDPLALPVAGDELAGDGLVPDDQLELDLETL